MKALFVGDVHNHLYIFEDVQRLDSQYNFDRVVFLGDYVDDWNTDNHDSLKTLDKLFTLKNSNLDKYILLFGNHEASYTGLRCSGHMEELSDVLSQKIKENINLFDFYYSIDLADKQYICTHAGLLNGYIENVLYKDFDTQDYLQVLDTMNKNKLKYMQLLKYCSFRRGGKELYGSFIWADKMEHFSSDFFDEPICKYQIIGHSPVQSIYKYDKESYNYYFIDTHSTYKDGNPFGDKSYLMWNDNSFKIVY